MHALTSLPSASLLYTCLFANRWVFFGPADSRHGRASVAPPPERGKVFHKDSVAMSHLSLYSADPITRWSHTVRGFVLRTLHLSRSRSLAALSRELWSGPADAPAPTPRLQSGAMPVQLHSGCCAILCNNTLHSRWSFGVCVTVFQVENRAIPSKHSLGRIKLLACTTQSC